MPTNLDLVQFVLLWMPYDDSTIVIFLKRILKYKSIYMSGYVCPNIVMKVLQEICKTLLYVDTNVSIRWDRHNLVDFANACQIK